MPARRRGVKTVCDRRRYRRGGEFFLTKGKQKDMGTRELTAKGREILERDQKIIEAALKLGIVGSEEGMRKGKWEMPKASDKIKALVDYNLLLKKAARVLAAGDDVVEKLKRFGFETPA